jgi:hypothetical protein
MNFTADFYKNPEYPIWGKFHSRSYADTCEQTDRQTDGRTKGRTDLKPEGFLERFNVTGNNRQYWAHYVRGLTFLPNFNQIWIFLRDFEESLNKQFYENPYSAIGADMYLWWTGKRRDMTEETGVFAAMKAKLKIQNYQAYYFGSIALRSCLKYLT